MIAAGLARAGDVVGSNYALYRPTGPFNPLTGKALISINAVFDPSPDLSLKSPEFQRQNQGFLIGDMSVVEPGDYLIGPETWFVSHIEPLRPAACVLCNRVMSVSVPATAPAAGANTYGGNTAATQTVIASGWPASALTKTHIEIDPTKLPTDTKTSFFEVLLPQIPGVTLSFGFLLQDDLAQTYTISAAELSISGWRLLAGIQTT